MPTSEHSCTCLLTNIYMHYAYDSSHEKFKIKFFLKQQQKQQKTPQSPEDLTTLGPHFLTATPDWN